MKAGHRRRWKTLVGFLALISLVAASMATTGWHAELRRGASVETAVMEHGEHAGMVQAGHHENSDYPAPCEPTDGSGDPNCCLGMVCPMTVATLSPAYLVSEAFQFAPLSFAFPADASPTGGGHSAVFRPPIPSV